MGYLDKDKTINIIVQNCCIDLKLSVEQCERMQRILNDSFEGIEFDSKKYELSSDRCNNEILIKNFCGCKKMIGIKDSSLNAYIQTLKTFNAFNNKNLLDVTTNDIRRFILNYEFTVSNRTANNARRNLNSFFQFLEDEGYILQNPCKRIKNIKEEQKVKRFYTELEMEQMRDACIDKRELAIIDFLRTTGVRVSEACSIKLEDIDWNNRVFIVNGKGNKQRCVPFTQKCKMHLLDYLQNRKGNSEYLFCSVKAPYNQYRKLVLKQ